MEGIIIGASVLAVILVVAFILLTVATGYYYYRKNKVVIVKVCMAWVTYIVYITVHDITQYKVVIVKVCMNRLHMYDYMQMYIFLFNLANGSSSDCIIWVDCVHY